jgi:uncharacterized protein with NRDE domain
MTELDADLLQDVQADVFLSKPQTVKAIRMSQPFFLTTLDGKKTGKTGDWLVFLPEGQRVIMTDFQFHKNYCASLESKCLEG